MHMQTARGFDSKELNPALITYGALRGVHLDLRDLCVRMTLRKIVARKAAYVTLILRRSCFVSTYINPSCNMISFAAGDVRLQLQIHAPRQIFGGNAWPN